MESIKPSVIGVGFGKAGTSYISAVLAKHQNVCFAKHKETHFFRQNFGRGWDWYHQMFDGFDPDRHRVVMEWTVDYINDLDTLYRIRDSLGEDIPLLIAYRDPVEVFRSVYFYRRMLSQRFPDDGLSQKECLDRFPEVYVTPYYYDVHLERLLDVFPRASIHFIDHAQLVRNPDLVFEDLYRFLGVPNSDAHRETLPVNQTITHSNPFVDRALRKALTMLHGEVKATELYFSADPEKPLWVRWIQRLNEGEKELDPQLRPRLEEMHAPHMQRFRKMLSAIEASAPASQTTRHPV